MSAPAIAQPVTAPAMPAPLNVPVRNIFLTLTLTAGTLALFGYLWREQGYEMLIVTMGWPHVALGFVFYFGKVLRGETHARGAFAALALVTLAIWTVHYNYAITGFIYLYFLYHAFRDEIFVYLQTRARHRPGPGLYTIAGVGPAILLMLLIPQQQDFRHDLRRTEFTGAQIAKDGWTLISFKPVPNSRGREFYFYLQAPHTEGVRAFVTQASADSAGTRRVLVADQIWAQASELVFQRHYEGEREGGPSGRSETAGTVPVGLTGGHRVGQTFKADRNGLDGLWLPISRTDTGADATNFVFHLASPPLLPYPAPLENLRLLLIVFLGAVVVWKLVPRRGQSNQLWIYLIVLAAGFGITQTILKSSNNAGYAFPLIFQFVVVFHYWSWYVFSFDKLRVFRGAKPAVLAGGWYDRMLGYLRRAPYFTAAVLAANLISAAGVFWYYRFNGPTALRFAFDYNYFLYFLVFHVTFSFNPKPRPKAIQPTAAVAPAA